MSKDNEPLDDEAIEEAVSAAKEQTEDLIERMMRKTIKEWDQCDSEAFKVSITIEGERKRGGQFIIQAKGLSTVELKMKDQTEAKVIDYGPNLFSEQQVQEVEAVPCDEEPEEDTPLLGEGRKMLPAPEEIEGDADVLDGDAPEDVPGDEED